MKLNVIAAVFSVFMVNAVTGLSAQGFNIPSNIPATEIPVVRMSPLIAESDLNISIASAIMNLRRAGEKRLAGEFQKLMAKGTYVQKYEFVYGEGDYAMPEEFIEKAPVNKTIAECVAKWACKTYTHAVTYYQCDSNNENCEAKIRNEVEKACNWEC